MKNKISVNKMDVKIKAFKNLLISLILANYFIAFALKG